MWLTYTGRHIFTTVLKVCVALWSVATQTVHGSCLYPPDASGHVVIPNTIGTSIQTYAFHQCSGLTSVVIADTVQVIGDYAFSETGLTSVVVPDSVQQINNYAFYNNQNLASVVIGDATTSIGHHCFGWCQSLSSVFIPDSVTALGIGLVALPSCLGFGLELTSNNLNNRRGDVRCIPCFNETSLVIPDTVSTIGTRAFYSCTTLLSIVIPDSVTRILQSFQA